MFILIGGLSIPQATIYASKVTTIDKELQGFLENVDDIQKQFSSLLVSAYTNNIEKRSNSDTLKTLEFAKTGINQLSNALQQYPSTSSLDKLQKAKLQSLIASVDLLKYMNDTLIDYIKTKDPYDQLQLLKVYFKLDTLLSQFIIDFKYVDVTSPTIPFSN